MIAPAGQISAGPMAWAGVLSAPTGMLIPLAVNDPPAATPILYDGHFGAPTPKREAVEFTFRGAPNGGIADEPCPRVPFYGFPSPGRPVPHGQVVVGATEPDGAQLDALRNTFHRDPYPRTVAIRFATDPVASTAWARIAFSCAPATSCPSPRTTGSQTVRCPERSWVGTVAAGSRS